MHSAKALKNILNSATGKLASAGISNPQLEARWLLAALLECSLIELHDEPRTLESSEQERLSQWIRRRANAEPLQYIIGSVDFLNLKIKCDPRALIPRPETEELAAYLMERFEPPARALELGVGSGAVALALASAWPETEVVGLEKCPKALSLAAENAASCGLDGRVRWVHSDWFSALGSERFGLIVANPPYLSLEDWEAAQPEVRNHEPRKALLAAENGLGDLFWILRHAKEYLLPKAPLVLETDASQHAALESVAKTSGLVNCESVKDLRGFPRVFVAFAH